MKIACLGWGSLIWRPENLPIQNSWFENGPMLPIEFTRISSNDRVTLIIDKKAKPIRTLWTLMTKNNLSDCINSLAQREETNSNNIHHISTRDSTDDDVKMIIKEWLLNNNLDTAIWTALSFSSKTNNIRPDIQIILKHLDTLDTDKKKKAEEYIRKAPKQIDTDYRREIEAKFGWTNLD